jgi:hypothetical protein
LKEVPVHSIAVLEYIKAYQAMMLQEALANKQMKQCSQHHMRRLVKPVVVKPEVSDGYNPQVEILIHYT